MEGDTILHCAVRGCAMICSNLDLVKMIMEYSTPNLLIRNKYGYTAYDTSQRFPGNPCHEYLRMKLLLQCNTFLRQKWIHMDSKTVTKKNDEAPPRVLVSRKRKKNKNN